MKNLMNVVEIHGDICAHVYLWEVHTGAMDTGIGKWAGDCMSLGGEHYCFR